MPDDPHNNTVDEEQENLAKLETLKAAIAEGLAGPSEDGEIVFKRLRMQIVERAAAEPEGERRTAFRSILNREGGQPPSPEDLWDGL
ncbi:MAG: hypothetical protein ABSE46_24810 [Terracidiphilus sp.]|jgi:hypothetical protein